MDFTYSPLVIGRLKNSAAHDKTDIYQFRAEKKQEFGRDETFDEAPHAAAPMSKLTEGESMACTNCSCPFFELNSDGGVLGSGDLNCIVTNAVKEVRFVAGDVLFAQGQLSNSLFSVSEGVVKITSSTSDGREQIIGLSHPGKLLVGLQSIGDNSYEYSAIAATDVTACKISHRALLTAVGDEPDIAMRLIAALNAQLAHSRTLMEVMGHNCAAAKIASFLIMVAPQPINGNGTFTLPFSRNDIAGLLGLSEETVCRQMAKLKREGVIHAPRGTVEVKDWRALHAIADGVAD